MSAYKAHRETKTCPVCNRPFQNRKKWASRGIWSEIKYCSDKCRVSAGKNKK